MNRAMRASRTGAADSAASRHGRDRRHSLASGASCPVARSPRDEWPRRGRRGPGRDLPRHPPPAGMIGGRGGHAFAGARPEVMPVRAAAAARPCASAISTGQRNPEQAPGSGIAPPSWSPGSASIDNGRRHREGNAGLRQTRGMRVGRATAVHEVESRAGQPLALQHLPAIGHGRRAAPPFAGSGGMVRPAPMERAGARARRPAIPRARGRPRPRRPGRSGGRDAWAGRAGNTGFNQPDWLEPTFRTPRPAPSSATRA